MKSSNFWQQKNVFVTGATGLLGSWLTEELVNQGANVVCLVRDSVHRSRFLQTGLYSRVTTVRGELEQAPLLVRTLNEYEIDTVFHLAAQTIVGTATRSPISTFESNIRGSWNLLEACRLNSRLVKRVLVASSDKAYGVPRHLPYNEDSPLEGRFPYDVSKSCTDLITLCYFHTFGLPVAVTRCGNLFGGGDLNYNRLIPGTIRSVLRGEAPIIRSDGKFVRDYFYVRDAVSAYLSLAAQLSRDNVAGQAFNFSSGSPLSVLELVDILLRVMGRPDLRPVVENRASNEIPEQYLDSSKAARILGWKSTYTLEAAIAETVAWYTRELQESAAPAANTEWARNSGMRF